MVSNSSKMSPAPEIKLSGNSLGQRHRHFNSLVREAFERGDTIESLPENTPVNKLFKIDLASKQRNFDYVLECLKSDDMLYVSRALKSKLLLDSEYEHIVTPSYLEDVLYPEMLTTAVSRMKHWIYINLRDPRKCQAFYEYYKEKNFEFAFKFLCKCSTEFILSEVSKVLIKLTPHYLKLLCEKSPHVARIYFDALQSNVDLKALYLKNEKDFYNSVKCAIKSDAPLVLDIAEKYFRQYLFDKFSPLATRFIMKYHKDRFWRKPELYTTWFFDTKVLARYLSEEESKQLVLRLARANYLHWWFSYKSVEPLIKRLKPVDRAAFKKKVFVQKDFGEGVAEWPYSIPDFENLEYVDKSIFDENESRIADLDSCKMLNLQCCPMGMRISKRCDFAYADCEGRMFCKPVTKLDQLFNEFRFYNYDKTLFELRKRINMESSNQNRQYMMLVLVSKSGGREEALSSLLELLARHGNEPSHLRAAVVRSLTKRACIWRLSNNSWEQLLLFAHGLGLDGKTAEADCREGLHAVVIRSLLLTGECEPKIQDAFLQKYSMLTDYKFSAVERRSIAEALPKIPLSAAIAAADVKTAVEWIDKSIKTLKAYKVRVDTYPGLLEIILDLAKKDIDAVRVLLLALFEAKIARRELFGVNFEVVQNDCSYINALRHDIEVLSFEKFLKLDKVPERFLRSLAIYFSENDGLADKFLSAIKTIKPQKIYARAFAYLLRNELGSYLQELDESKDKDKKQLSGAIRANAHVARPSLDLDKFGWRWAGTKLIANRILQCRAIDINVNIQKLLENRQTAKLAIILALRNNNEHEVFEAVVSLRPLVALKNALTYLRRQCNKADVRVWLAVKPIMESIDLSKPSLIYVRKNVMNVDSIPPKIKPDYCSLVYTAVKDVTFRSCEPIKILLEIYKLLPFVNEQYIYRLLITDFLFNFDVKENEENDTNDKGQFLKLFCIILIKFVLLSKSVVNQNHNLETLVDPFLKCMKKMWMANEHKLFFTYFKETLFAVKYHTEFLNQTYVSRQPLLERIVKWMQDILPRERYFDKYAQIHLLMLYFKALGQCLKQASDIFVDPKKKINEGVTMTGRVFGSYIALELRELRASYFDSIVEIYASSLLSYIEEYTAYAKTDKFVIGIIKGILESTDGSESLLSLRLLRGNWYSISKQDRDELCEIIKTKDNRELQYFYNATVNNTFFY